MSASSTRVAIVTPTYNMAPFLRDAIDSVLAQDHPHIDYVVVDGGSTDGTVELLRSYGDRLRWVSEPDRGQAHAVNKGLAATEGEVFAFLNADDTYLPGAVGEAVAALARRPEAAGVYGRAWYVDRDGRRLGEFPTEEFSHARLAETCFICQPATFVRRSAVEALGGFDEDLFYALDYDLWIRMSHAGLELAVVDAAWAAARMHAGSKTLRARARVHREVVALVKSHYGYVSPGWLWAQACHLGDPGADQFFTHARRGPRAAARTFALGLQHNRGQLARWVRDYVMAGLTKLRHAP